MFARRLLSAAVGIPLLIAVVAVGGRLYDAILSVVLLLATIELLIQAGLSMRGVWVWIAGAGAAALGLLTPAARLPDAGLVVSVFVLLCVLLISARRGLPLTAPVLAICVGLYVGWLGQYLGLLRHVPRGWLWVYIALFVTFASDSGAYVVGRLLGRHRLAPSISPGKTIEGAVGGLAGAALAMAALSLALEPRPSPQAALLIGLCLSVVAQAGDLLESALKRSLGVKDAGILVPGHGGLLDRLDSLLLVGTVVYFLVKWVSL